MQATQILRNEHDVIERVLDLLEQAVERIRSEQPVADGFAPWAVEFFRKFADRCHHGKEEDVLFPLLEQRGIPRAGGPIGVMLFEHTVGRGCVTKMNEAVCKSPCDCNSFAAAASEYAALLREHIAKENNVLFKMAEARLSDEDDRRLIDQFQEAEHAKGGCELHARFERELQDWEQQFAGNDDGQAVIASYHRCEDAGGLFDTFYEKFFAKSPEIPRKFANTDMERQKQVVMASLLWLLRLYQGDSVARDEVEKIAASHSRGRHDVRPEFYELWLDALCESVAIHDPQFTAGLESQWRRVVRVGIDVMTSKY